MPRLCLKKIDLIGFKSFADRTTLHFEEGVTAIVGPNGCGKSNVADAFRWVMGEQSARSLRGEKMADVLFAGTSKRKGAPYCEVTLTFDNSDGHLALPYQEAAITRRLTRKGDSDYRINGQTVRLKDVHHLFFDTGLGKDAFAIFEQGKIEEIILRSPEERRPIFEQVSGIARYRHQWKEAQRKLAQTEQHLTRVADITNEVEKQTRLLEKQVTEANAFKRNKQRLEDLERALLTAKWLAHQGQLEEASQQLKKLKEKQTHATGASLELGRAKERAKQALAEQEATLKTSLEQFYAIRAAFTVQEAESEGLAQRLEEIAQRKSQCHKEQGRIAEEQTTNSQEAKAIQTERAALREQVEEAESALKESQGVLSDCQKSLHRCQEEQVALQKQQMDQVQKAHALANRLKEGEVRLETIAERLAQLDIRGGELTQAVEEHEVRFEERVGHSEQLTTEVKGQRKGLHALTETLSSLEEGLTRLVSQQQQLTTDLTNKQARQTVLLQLEEERGAHLLLQAARETTSPFYDQLLLLTDTAIPLPGYAKQIASGLQLYSGTLFAKTDEAFVAAWEWATKEGLSGFSITTPSLLQRASRPISPNLASAIEPGSPLIPLFESLSTIEGTSAYLRPDGSLLDHSGVLFAPPSQEESPVMRKAELKELAAGIRILERERDRLQGEQQRSATQKETLLTQKQTLEQSLRQHEMKLVELNVSLERTRADLDLATSEQKKTGDEQNSLKALQQQLTSETETLQREADKARAGLTECQKGADAVANELATHLDRVRDFAKTRRVREQKLHELSLKRHSVESSATLSEAKTLNLQKETHRLSTEIADLAKKETELTEILGALEKPAANDEELKTTEEGCKTLEEGVATVRTQLEMLEKEEEEERRHLQELDKSAHTLDIQIAKEKTASEALAEEMSERFVTEIAQSQAELDLPLKEAEQEVKSLRKTVEGTTEVNLAAASEYDEKKERHHFLSQQLDDLVKSKEELAEIIAELDRESRERFQATFEEVRRHFQEQFQILFEGGEADLTFTGAEDILQAGIDIIAKPPGKKMRSIKLLSGGEKCLTAMALLFALFKVQPAPFCILDEMDAPLDDSNIERFLNVVKPFMEKTQFLIITHNKRTMAAADILFGVTMQEKGVSKILSLEFEKASQLPSANFA